MPAQDIAWEYSGEWEGWQELLRSPVFHKEAAEAFPSQQCHLEQPRLL